MAIGGFVALKVANTSNGRFPGGCGDPPLYLGLYGTRRFFDVGTGLEPAGPARHTPAGNRMLGFAQHTLVGQIVEI